MDLTMSVEKGNNWKRAIKSITKLGGITWSGSLASFRVVIRSPPN
jgi:hypothetical protein